MSEAISFYLGPTQLLEEGGGWGPGGDYLYSPMGYYWPDEDSLDLYPFKNIHLVIGPDCGVSVYYNGDKAL